MLKYRLFFLILFTVFVLTACTGGGANTVALDRDRPVLGRSNAPLLIEEFSDLQCPACAQISPQVERIVKDNPHLARMKYYHFPLAQHENAFQAAEASECAADQGHFWDYVGLLFKNQKSLNQDNLIKLGESFPMDQEKFSVCVKSGEKKAMVKADLFEGRTRGVRATPTFYINGQQVQFGGYDPFLRYLQTLAAQQTEL
jgi:protein-disulfide isomerase